MAPNQGRRVRLRDVAERAGVSVGSASQAFGRPELVSEQVRERVRAFEALGVEELILSPWVLPFAVIEPEIVEVFAEHVMPACR